MEIIKIKNAEDKDVKKEFGCKCPRCGTSFIFTMNDAIVPRKLSYSIGECKITCPNHSCNNLICMGSPEIVRLTNEDERQKFIEENK